jgi:hypothetical protein
MRFWTENRPFNLEPFEAKGDEADAVRLSRVLAEAKEIWRVRLVQLAAIAILLCTALHEATLRLAAWKERGSLWAGS